MKTIIHLKWKLQVFKPQMNADYILRFSKKDRSLVLPEPFPTQYASKERFKEFIQYLKTGSKFLKYHLLLKTTTHKKTCLPEKRQVFQLFQAKPISFSF